MQAIDARLGGVVREIRADGGPTRNAFLMQHQADLLAMPVAVSLEPDMTALGAALLAAIGADGMAADEAAAFAPQRRVYEPAIGADERGALWHEWRRAIAMVCERAGA